MKSQAAPCARCFGYGYCSRQLSYGGFTGRQVCPSCGGSGKVAQADPPGKKERQQEADSHA